jgi:hypothetical protein
MRLPNFGYHLARFKGRALRRLYQMLLPKIVRRPVKAPREFPFSVYAYSSEAMLPEQVRSIRSFLRYVGRPKSFTVVSDGSHSERSIRLLTNIDPTVAVRLAGENLPTELPAKLQEYLAAHPTGKQLALIMSLPSNGPALYVDADVLFFPGANDLITVAQERSVPAFYLADCRFSGDERLLRDASEKDDPVNTGFLLLFQKLDWSLGLERFRASVEAPNFFTNQTIAHLVMHANGARPFDPLKYLVRLDDQFVYEDRHAGPALALRHYVNPVRHKFWAHFIR